MFFLTRRKARLRARMMDARAALHGASPEAAEALTRNFPDEAWPKIGQVVSGFMPIGNEIDPLHLLKTFSCEGAVIALPVARKGHLLEFREWTPGDPLKKVGMGLSEPLPTAASVEPTLVIAPLLAFDMKGRRLGYGGGFYDRWLAQARAARPQTLVVGVAYEGQRVGRVPANRLDQLLDWVVTEKAAHRIRR